MKKGSGALAKSIYVMTTDQNPRGTGSGAKAYESQATGTRTSIASMAAEGIQVGASR